jgi:hypothetical protein
MKKNKNLHKEIVEFLESKGFVEIKGEEKRKAIAKIKREERAVLREKKTNKSR